MKTEIAPMVNQIEFHPGLMQKETVRYCKENNIMVEAWSPLGTGRMLVNPVLKELAGKYGGYGNNQCASEFWRIRSAS